MASREKGVATAPCPECGKDLPLMAQADGSWAAQTCPSCHPKTKKERAAAEGAGREVGTAEAAAVREEGVR